MCTCVNVMFEEGCCARNSLCNRTLVRCCLALPCSDNVTVLLCMLLCCYLSLSLFPRLGLRLLLPWFWAWSGLSQVLWRLPPRHERELDLPPRLELTLFPVDGRYG